MACTALRRAVTESRPYRTGSTRCARTVRYFRGMATAVLTRDPVDVPSYARVLAPLGLDVIAMPVTRTVSAADPDALVRALGDGVYSAIVVASPRAAAELGRAHGRIA